MAIGIIFARGGSNQSQAFQPQPRPDPVLNQAIAPFFGVRNAAPSATTSTHQFDAYAGIAPTAFAEVRATVAVYTNNDGLVLTAAANTERIDYDPITKALLGLYIEPSGTNRAPNSETLTQGGGPPQWLVDVPGPTLTNTAILDPRGTKTGQTVNLGTTSASGGGVYINIAGQPAGSTFIFSSWVKSSVSSGASFFRFTYNNTLGWTGGSGSTKFTPTSVWTRFSLTGTVPSNGSINIGYDNRDSTSAWDSTCTGSIDIWGPQLEIASSASSYIRTTSQASVTRAADSYSFTLGASQTSIQFTFDDGSTQTVSGLTGGATYTIPTSLNRARILYWDDPAALGVNLTAAQTLDALVTAATDTVLAQATIAQDLGVLGQAAADTVLDQAVIAQTLSALAQSATASAPASAITSQTLGPLGQTLTTTVPIAITIAQNLGALTQSVDATHPDTVAAAQTLGTIVQAATGGAIDAATAAQTLSALAQAATVTSGIPVTWDPSFKDAEITLSNGNLTASTSTTVNAIVRSTTTNSAGYFEQVFSSITGGSSTSAIGFLNASETIGNHYLGHSGGNSIGYYSNGNVLFAGGTLVSGLATYGAGDVIGAEITTTPSIKFYKNGTLVYTATSIPSGSLYAGLSLNVSGDTGTVNLGASAMSYLPVGITSWDGSQVGSFHAAVAQTLGALGQAATVTDLDQAVVNQTLAALSQSAAITHPDSVAVNQNLAALTQVDTASVIDAATAAQNLGGIVQTATGGVVDAATAAQVLGTLAQAAIAIHPVNLAATQTLGALSQTATDTVTDAAVVAQVLAAIVQATTGTVVTSASVAQALSALVQAATGTVIDTATTTQPLGPLGQVVAATVVSPSSLSATQILGALGQALTGVVVDTATVAQSLEPLGQSVAATHADTAAVAQTLGAIIQATTGSLIDAAVVSQALEALNQVAAATTASGFQAAQTLGGIVQALTGTAIDAATVAQALGGLGQVATGGVVTTVPARTDSLGPLGQTATAGHVSFVNVAQVLGTLSQIATAQGPGEADFLVSQILGGLQQIAASNVPERLQATQALQALGQTVALRITPVAGVAIHGSAVKLQRGLGSLGQKSHLVGSLKQKPILVGKSRGRTILLGSIR